MWGMRLFVLWLLLVSVLPAEEELSIEAFWLGPERFRMELAPEYGDKMPERKVSEVQPEESRFIDEGDVLWDLAEHYQQWDIGAAEGWIVYNETSGYLVAKAEAQDLGALELRHSVDEAIKNVRYRLEVFMVGETPAEWVGWRANWKSVEKRLLFGTEGTGRSGETVTQIFTAEEGLNVSLELQPSLGRYGQIHDLRIALAIESPSWQCSLNTGFSLVDHQASLLELGTVKSGEALVARVVPDALLVGGPVQGDWHLFENKEQEAALRELSKYSRHLLSESNGHLGYFELPATFIPNLSDDEEKEIDPFSNVESVLPKLRENVDSKALPLELKKYFPHENWTDVSSLLSDSGIDFGEQDFAYFGHVKSILLVRFSDPNSLELVGMIAGPLHYSYRPTIFQTCYTLIRDVRGEQEVFAKSVLMVRSGETATIEWKWDAGSWNLETRPTMGANEQIYDVRLFSGYERQGKFEINTGVTYKAGEPQEFLLKETDGESFILRLEVVAVDPYGELIGD